MKPTNGMLGSLLLLLLSALGTPTGTASGQTPDKDDKARITQLENEVQALKDLVKQQVPTEKKGDATPPQERKDDPVDKSTSFVVGDDRKLIASWEDGGLRLRSSDEAFTIHVGGRLHTDEVWWTQSPNLKQSPIQPPGFPIASETGVGPGIGDLLDGFFVRRARFMADGTIWQTIDYKVEFDFENYNNISFDESYVGARDLPYLDIVRIGQEHVPFGLEAYASSRFLPMMERSPLFDAFYQEFAPGIFTDRTFFDQHATMQHMFHRIDNFSQFNGASFGDGKYAYSGRFTVLPVYEYDGRCLLHFGLAYQWRKGSIPLDFNGGTVVAEPVATNNTDLVRFRARPSLRDAVGLQGNGSRVIDTGNIIADHVQSVNGELLWYWNSFWVQSETCLSQVDNAFFPAGIKATPRGTLNYYGTYIQIGYFLTGDSRGYDRRMGKYDRVHPLENFFLVRDEDGRVQYGLGAWEVLYRFSWVNLDDGFVYGGRYGEHTVGLNWYWSGNIKLQFNYINGQRSVPEPAGSGNIQGFGLRAALEF